MSVSIIINSTEKHTLDNCLLHSFLHNDMALGLILLSLTSRNTLSLLFSCFFLTLCDNGEGEKVTNWYCIIVIGRHNRLRVKKEKKKSIFAWSPGAIIKIMRGVGCTTYRISIFAALCQYTVSGITAVPLMCEYWDYCHLCLHIFLWLMSSKRCVFQMRTLFICMIFLYMVQIWR